MRRLIALPLAVATAAVGATPAVALTTDRCSAQVRTVRLKLAPNGRQARMSHHRVPKGRGVALVAVVVNGSRLVFGELDDADNAFMAGHDVAFRMAAPSGARWRMTAASVASTTRRVNVRYRVVPLRCLS